MSDNLKQTIKTAMKTAMKQGEKERLSTIRLIMAEFKRIEVDERIEIDDARGLVILDKMLKQRRDSITQYEKAGRDELAAIEKNEIDVIQTFMPTPFSDAELDELISQAITTIGASSLKDMGKVMGSLKPQLQGRADMGKVGGKIKALLGN